MAWNAIKGRVRRAVHVESEISILVFGATGAGKTSLVDLFQFWSMETAGEVRLPEDLARAKQVSVIDTGNEAALGDQTKSKTQKPKSYDLLLQLSGRYYRVILIDTPGLGDVDGLAKDEEHVDNILAAVSAAPQLTAILLVLNGSTARLTPSMSYVLQKLYGMCPDAMAEKLSLLFTNTQLRPTFPYQQVLKIPVPATRVFCMDNLLFSANVYNQCSPPEQMMIANNYGVCKATLAYMFETWKSVRAVAPEAYKELKEQRDTLKGSVSGILSNIKELSRAQVELAAAEADVDREAPTLDGLREKAKLTVSIPHTEQQTTSYHNTVCLECKSCCHEKCGLEFEARAGAETFRRCACFSGGPTCTVCKHGPGNHSHARFKFRNWTEVKPLMTPAEQQQLSLLTNEQDAKAMVLKAINDQIQSRRTELSELHTQLMKVLDQLRALCSNFNYRLELAFGIEMLKDRVRTAATTRERVRADEMLTKFENMIDEFDKAVGGSEENGTQPDAQ